MQTNTLFNPMAVPCVCEGLTEDMCLCGQVGGAEKCLRFVKAVDGVLTAEQREWCLKEIDKVEGHTRKDFEGQPDRDVAGGVLDAWTDYCRDKGLL